MAGSSKLGSQAKALITASPPGHLAISSISLLELALLLKRGTIHFEDSPATFLTMVEERFVVLPQTAEIAWEAVDLPLPQKDPFDRLITATARIHTLSLITRDQKITRSGLVPTLW